MSVRHSVATALPQCSPVNLADDASALFAAVEKRHEEVRVRVSMLAYGYSGGHYLPLHGRLNRLRHQVGQVGLVRCVPAMSALLNDLHAIAGADDDQVRRMIAQNAETIAAHSSTRLAMDTQAAIEMAIFAATRPRVTAAELIVSFANRGITITAAGADLHVTPKAVLTDGDRALLREHKTAFLHELNARAEVI